MTFIARSAIAGLSALGAAAVSGAVLLGAAATAVADDGVPAGPNCTAADLAGVMAGVTTATSAYLFTHPEVNTFFTSLKGMPREEMRGRVQAYLDANPRVRDEIGAIREPSLAFRERCGVASRFGE
jgi:hemophore-related protein